MRSFNWNQMWQELLDVLQKTNSHNFVKNQKASLSQQHNSARNLYSPNTWAMYEYKFHLVICWSSFSSRFTLHRCSVLVFFYATKHNIHWESKTASCSMKILHQSFYIVTGMGYCLLRRALTFWSLTFTLQEISSPRFWTGNMCIWTHMYVFIRI